MVYITHFLKQVTKIAVEAFVKYEYMNHCKNMKKTDQYHERYYIANYCCLEH